VPPHDPQSVLQPNLVNETPVESTETSIQSELVDGQGKISIDRMLEAHRKVAEGNHHKI